MSIDQELLQREYARGEEAGIIKSRVGNLETVVGKISGVVEGSVALLNTTVTTLELLAQEVQARADADRMLREQERQAADDKAQALKEERVNAASALRNERESKATILANEVNKANIRFIPRMYWVGLASVFVVALIGGISFYATYHR